MLNRCRFSQLLALAGLIYLLTGCTLQPIGAQLPLPTPAPLPALIAERRYSEALGQLESQAAQQPDSPTPLIQMGQIYLAQRRWLLAEDAFNRALARDPASAPALAGLAEVKFNQGDWLAAQELGQQAAHLNPNLPGVFTLLGRTHLSRLAFDAARAAFLQQQARRPDPAAQWYLAALTAPTNLPAATETLLSIPLDAPAQVLAQRDYLLAALAPFTPESPPGEVARAVGVALVQAEMWPLAVNALTAAQAQAVSPSPAEQAGTLAFLGHALAQSGRPALEMFEQARQLNPNSALPRYFYGIYLRQQNALNAAAQSFNAAIERDPTNAAIVAQLALTYVEQGDFAAAEQAFNEAVALSEDALPMQLLQLRFYAGRGYRLTEAGIPLAEAIISGNPANAEAHHWLGWMQLLAGDVTQAEAALTEAVKLDPDSVGSRYHLARLREAQGDYETARSEFQHVVDWDLTGLYRQRALEGLQRLPAGTAAEP